MITCHETPLTAETTENRYIPSYLSNKVVARSNVQGKVISILVGQSASTHLHELER
nr:MAG TPA: hypothetical protein [Caudoviricetes sp.]